MEEQFLIQKTGTNEFYIGAYLDDKPIFQEGQERAALFSLYEAALDRIKMWSQCLGFDLFYVNIVKVYKVPK